MRRFEQNKKRNIREESETVKTGKIAVNELLKTATGVGRTGIRQPRKRIQSSLHLQLQASRTRPSLMEFTINGGLEPPRALLLHFTPTAYTDRSTSLHLNTLPLLSIYLPDCK